jgi:hypothetical protein
MCTFWAFNLRNSDLPGFTDYLSATWGDGLLLPIAAAAATSAVRSLPPSGGERRLTAWAAATGLGLGAATQILWLLDNQPSLNWTLPAPHHFNAAGVYHAGFLVAASGYAGALTGLLLRRLTSTPRTDRPATAVMAAKIATAAVVGFTGLLLADNVRSAGTAATRATLAATAAGAAVAVLWGRRKRR